MRPTTTTTADALIQGATRPRKLSDTASAQPDGRERDHHSPPMMYFLADEATVQAAAATAASNSAAGSMISNGSSSSGNFGVRSLATSVSDAELQRGRKPAPERKEETTTEANAEEEDEDDEKDDEDDGEDDDDELEGLDSQSIASMSTANPGYTSSVQSPKTNLSQPLTPVLGPSNAPSPVLGSPAISRGDYERAEESLGGPQLIMPQITMPSRRPFTEKGKRIGKVKVLIAGDSGIGKTSLIKSIVQTCEDIVHVDPVSAISVSGSSRHASKRSGDSESTKKITEVYASTRPYPHWWSEINENKVLRRRKSRSGGEEQVIERNLCFVDTPGYGSGTSFLECIEPVVRYVEGQFERTQSIISNGDGDLMTLLSGAGTPQVDIVFYVVLHRLKPVDVEFIRRLSPLTNVLPIIAKSDTLSLQQVTNLKLAILNDLRQAGIRPFLFGKTAADILQSSSNPEEAPSPTAPFAISSVVSSDSEVMDASVLMSPDYVPPLLDTELKLLVDQVFDPDNIAWLKHSAAKKYMSWCTTNSTSLVTLRNPTSPPRRPSTPVRGSPSASGMLTSSGLIHLSGPAGGAADSFALARVADHTQREERLARVRLSRWANDLQKSLAAERERYERLARGERAVWLTERLGECIADGQLVPISSINKAELQRIEAQHNGGIDTRDPFGILQINEAVGRKVLVMIKIAGLSGLVGVVGVWIYRQWGGAGLGELMHDVGNG